MRSLSKVFLLGVGVFIFCFLSGGSLFSAQSPAQQKSSKFDTRGQREEERDLLRRRGFYPNPDIRGRYQFMENWIEQSEVDRFANPMNLDSQGRNYPLHKSANTPLNYLGKDALQAIIYDFLVNDDTTGGAVLQMSPAIACAPSGNFMITWEDRRDGGYSDVYAQRYDSYGSPVGSNFKVNDVSTPYLGTFPAIAMDSAGNLVITWGDHRNGNWDIYAQRFDSSGNPLGFNFKVNDDVGDRVQYTPAIAMNGSGDFIITWEDHRRDNGDVYAKRYNSSGTAIGSGFKVNDDTGFDLQGDPDIAVDGSGNFVITWTDGRNYNYSYYDIFAQRYDSAGTPLGSNFMVNDDTTASQNYTRISMTESGTFVIVWEDRRNWPSFAIYAQRYDVTGAPLGKNFRVSDSTMFYNTYPDVVTDWSGNFIVTWIGMDLFSGVFAQKYDSLGNPLGVNFFANDTSGQSIVNCPAIALDYKGNFVITWEDYRNDTLNVQASDPDIYAQRHDSAGNSIGGNFRVCDDFGAANQMDPAIASDSFGNFVIAWQDYRSDLSGSIYFQRYDSSGTPLDLNLKVGPGTWPAIAMGGLGNYVIAWAGAPQQYNIIWAQRYLSSGIPLDSMFQVNDDLTAGICQVPAVAVDGPGNFVITWQDDRNGFGDYDIYAQRYDSAGIPLGSNFRVNDGTGATSEVLPAVVSDKAGNFVIVWEDLRSGTNIYAQRYDSTGIPLGSNFKVNDAGKPGVLPAIAMESLGNFVVTWCFGDIYAQRYNSSGIALGSNFKVTDYAPSVTSLPTIAIDISGNFVIAWEDYRQGNYDNPDIYAQRFDASGNPIGGNYVVNNLQSVPFRQLYPAIAASTSNIFFAWQDNRRAKGWDIYAKVVDWTWTKVGEEQNANLPKSFELAQNYPNPFNPTTAIEYALPRASWVKIDVYNILGQKVKTLVDEHQLSGHKRVTWDGKNNGGQEISSGIYFYRIVAGDFVQAKKMMLVK